MRHHLPAWAQTVSLRIQFPFFVSGAMEEEEEEEEFEEEAASETDARGNQESSNADCGPSSYNVDNDADDADEDDDDDIDSYHDDKGCDDDDDGDESFGLRNR